MDAPEKIPRSCPIHHRFIERQSDDNQAIDLVRKRQTCQVAIALCWSRDIVDDQLVWQAGEPRTDTTKAIHK
jgi:hypothetical protein